MTTVIPAAVPRVQHDPHAVLPYRWNWSLWLAEQGGTTIASHTVTPPAGIELGGNAHTDTTVTAWLSGGVRGETYRVVCHIVTVDGQEEDQTIELVCLDR